MECQLKDPSPQNKVCGLLTNKAMSDQALVVVGHTVEFEPAKHRDPKQLWTKWYMKDGQGAFMLVNAPEDDIEDDGKAVKALQHSLGPSKPVRVVDIIKRNLSNVMQDHSTLLWTDTDGGNGFMVIRESKNTDALVLDAQNRKLVVDAKDKGGADSQLWKFVMPQPKA